MITHRLLQPGEGSSVEYTNDDVRAFTAISQTPVYYLLSGVACDPDRKPNLFASAACQGRAAGTFVQTERDGISPWPRANAPSVLLERDQ